MDVRLKAETPLEPGGRPGQTAAMPSTRYVFLDPIGASTGGWLSVIMSAPTGVVYQTQYGGTACRPGAAEGFLVPIFGDEPDEGLRDLFELHFQGAGTRGHDWDDAELNRLRRLIGEVEYWSCDGRDETSHPLVLDERLLHEVDEAWIPVSTPDGPGILTWMNSD